MLIRSKRTQIILSSFCFGLLVWVLEGIIDSWFYQGDFLDLLILHVPKHEVYIRVLVLVSFVGYGIIHARIFVKNQKTEEEIRHNEQTLRGLLNGIRDSVCLVSSEGITLAFNGTAIKLLKKPSSELIQKDYLTFVDPTFRPILKKMFQKAIEQKSFVREPDRF